MSPVNEDTIEFRRAERVAERVVPSDGAPDRPGRVRALTLTYIEFRRKQRRLVGHLHRERRTPGRDA